MPCFAPGLSERALSFTSKCDVSWEYADGAPNPCQGSGASMTKGGEAPVCPVAGRESRGPQGPHLAGTFLVHFPML